MAESAPMARLPMYQVDAFASAVFKGNPAAVVPLPGPSFLPDHIMQDIATENNLSETAFLVRRRGTLGEFDLRWFTPREEIDLCGHATLGAAYVVWRYVDTSVVQMTFHTRSGPLVVVKKEGGIFEMDFPAIVAHHDAAKAKREIPFLEEEVFGGKTKVVELLRTKRDYIAVVATEESVKELAPRFDKLSEMDLIGLIVTAKSSAQGVDFISRAFFPRLGVNEDPVCGSAHCEMAPYWAAQLGKTIFTAHQLSRRGGQLHVELKGDRVSLSGTVAPYLEGFIHIPIQ